MFIGNYNHNLDDKGRITIPNAYKEQFGEQFVCVQGFEECIYLFTKNDWASLEERISALSFTKKANRKFARLFMSNAFYVNVDSKGRINLESVLINHAHLKKECVFVGASNRVELWDKETWAAYKDENADDYEMIAEEVDF